MKRTHVLLALALAFAASGAQADLVWKWTGPNGKPMFGKQPPPGVRAEQVEVMPTKPGAFNNDRSTVDISKLPKAAAPQANPDLNPDGTPKNTYCPPNVTSCKKKLAKGDKPMTPPIPEGPVDRDKDGNPMK